MVTTRNTARRESRPPLIASRPRRRREPSDLAIIDQHRCTGCEACLAFCPVDCIETVPGADFAQFGQSVEVDIERCIGCVLCAQHCPWDAILTFTYETGILKAPSLTVKSVCGQKTAEDSRRERKGSEPGS